MTVQIGTGVRERDAGARPEIKGPPIGAMGSVFESGRGPVNVALKSSGEDESKALWGGRNRDYNAWYQLRGFHRNCAEFGGDSWGVRVVSGSSIAPAPATITGVEVETFKMVTGDTLTVNTDGVGNEVTTFTGTPASVSGAAITYPKTYVGGETLVFTVQGEEYTVTFSAGAKTLSDVITEIGNEPAVDGFGFGAFDSSGQVGLRTDRAGTGAALVIDAASTALTLLGMSAGSNAGGGNVSNIVKVTVAEVKTQVELATTGLTVTSVGGKVKLTGTTAGASGSIVVVAGAGATAFGLTPGTVNGTNTATAAPTSASATFQRAATDVWKFDAGYLGLDSPGTWSNGLVFIQILENASDANKRDVFIGVKEAPATTPSIIERFFALDKDNVVSQINSPDSGSKYVKVSIVGGDTGVPDIAAFTDIADTTAGVDETLAPDNSEYESALNALDGKPIEVATNFDLSDSTWQASLEAYCAAPGSDVTGVFASPELASIATLKTSFAPLRGPKKHTAGYRNHITVNDDFGGTIKVSNVGRVIGAGYNRRRKERGIHPHLNPAGERTALADVVSIDNPTMSDADRDDMVINASINSIEKHPSKGFFFIRTGRSMSTDKKWVQVGTRLLANYIGTSFKTSMTVFEQETNSPETRGEVDASVREFMEGLDDVGAFEKEGGFDNNVSIVCTEANNPQSLRQDNRLRCDVSYVQAGVNEGIEAVIEKSSTGLAVTIS